MRCEWCVTQRRLVSYGGIQPRSSSGVERRRRGRALSASLQIFEGAHIQVHGGADLGLTDLRIRRRFENFLLPPGLGHLARRHRSGRDFGHGCCRVAAVRK